VPDRHAEQRDDFLSDRLVDEAAVLTHHVDRQVAHPRNQSMRLARAHLIDEREVVGDDGHQHRRAPPLRRRDACRVVERSP
jgi:hypothetical protein